LDLRNPNMDDDMHRLHYALALALLLFAMPAFADETLVPTATVSETNSDCTTSNAHTRLGDASDLTFCDGNTGSSAESYNLLVSFDTPAIAPDTGNVQQFTCRASKSDTTAGNGNPTFTMDLYCGGVLQDTGAAKTTTGVVATFTQLFTVDGTCNSDGSTVELQTTITRAGGAPAGRRSIDMHQCWWDVTATAATGRSRRSF